MGMEKLNQTVTLNTSKDGYYVTLKVGKGEANIKFKDVNQASMFFTDVLWDILKDKQKNVSDKN